MTTTAPTSGAPAAAAPPAAPAAKSANQSYNSELFLKLLVTQLANQDPSSPMDSAQMVSQTAQLASMEQLTSLNSTAGDNYQAQMQATATNMLGKKVTWSDANGVQQSGPVTAISFSSTGTPQLTVGSTTVALSAVTGVAAS